MKKKEEEQIFEDLVLEGRKEVFREGMRLIDLNYSLHESLFKAQEVKESLVKATDTIYNEVFAEVSAENNGGKPVYTNATSREAETENRLKINNGYHKLIVTKDGSERTIKNLSRHIATNEKRISMYRAYLRGME